MKKWGIIVNLILCISIIFCANIYAADEPETVSDLEETGAEILITADNDNIAVGSEVTVTNSNDVPIGTNVGDEPYKVVDGSYSTATSGTGIYEYNIFLKLNDTYPINKLSMVFLICKFEGNFEIQTSTDGISYTTVGNIFVTPTFSVSTSGTGDYRSTLEFDTVFAKYIKIKDTVSHSGMGFRVSEIEVYRDTDFSGDFFIPEITYETRTSSGEEQIEDLYAGEIRAKANILYYGENRAVSIVTGLYDKKKNEMISLAINTGDLISGENVLYNDIEVSSDLTGLLSYDEKMNSSIARGAVCSMYSTADGTILEANNGNLAEFAVDGDLKTKAQAAGAYDWTLQAELDKEYNISSINVVFDDNGFPVQYDVLVSSDGEEWKKVSSIYDNDRGGAHSINFEPINAKYIRIADRIPQPGVRQMQVCELEVFEKKLKSDFEVRSFLIDNTNDRNPLINRAVVID